MERKKPDLKHIKLSQEDRGILCCSKTILFNKNRELYHKMRMAIDAEEVAQFKIYSMSDEVRMAYKNGAAIMFHLMTNPEFLKDCENIYEK